MGVEKKWMVRLTLAVTYLLDVALYFHEPEKRLLKKNTKGKRYGVKQIMDN